jgi:hypothetical protein
LPRPPWVDTVEKVGGMLLESNNRMVGVDFESNLRFQPFESMLRIHSRKLFFDGFGHFETKSEAALFFRRWSGPPT